MATKRKSNVTRAETTSPALVTVRMHQPSYGLTAGQVVKVKKALADALIRNGHASPVEEPQSTKESND